MPRTKQARKGKSIDASSEGGGGLLLKDFERHVKSRLHKIQLEYESRVQKIETSYQMALVRFPQKVMKLTLGEIMNIVKSIDNECEVSSSVNDETISPAPPTIKAKRISKRTTATSDDGYMTEGGTTSTTTRNSVAPSTSKVRKVRTRSSSASRKTKVSDIAPLKTAKKEERVLATASSAIKNRFKTPAPLSKQCPNEYALVTPKVKPNTPLSIMRRPRQGEMALSMQGSPLLVTSVVNENVANVNVPLENGSVLSLLPNDGLRLSYLPQFDAETKRQLVTLKQHLDRVIGH